MKASEGVCVAISSDVIRHCICGWKSLELSLHVWTINKKNILMITSFPFIVENLTSRPDDKLRGKMLLSDFVKVELLGCVGLGSVELGGHKHAEETYAMKY